MKTRALSPRGPTVSAIGLGCMGMSDLYGPADEAESIATIHAALDAGVTLLDTGDYYGMGHNELLIREALQGRARDEAVISVKFGAPARPGRRMARRRRPPRGGQELPRLHAAAAGTDHVDVYRPGRVDPAVPIEETVGAIAEMVEAGYVRHVGLSEVGADTIRRAHAVHPIADLQIEYSLHLARDRGRDPAHLPRARHRRHRLRRALARTASGHWSQERETGRRDFRSHAPRFSGENLERNLALVDALRAVAERRARRSPRSRSRGCSRAASDIVPLVGARRRERLAESLGAARPRARRGRPRRDRGARCRPARPPATATTSQQMAILDSERS